MLSAFTSSSLFLISYLVYHYEVGSVPFKGQGGMRTVYFTILLTHTILAAAVVPLALITLTRALKERFAAHRRIARWTFPIWLYVLRYRRRCLLDALWALTISFRRTAILCLTTLPHVIGVRLEQS